MAFLIKHDEKKYFFKVCINTVSISRKIFINKDSKA